MTHREIVTELLVAAPPPVVWQVLTDFGSYPAWNPFLPSVAGEARPGKYLRAIALPARGPGMGFRALVTAARPGAELSWTGVLLWGWLFHGDHYFVLEELPGPIMGRRLSGEAPPARQRSPGTLLRHGEVMGGLLTPLVGRFMAAWMRPGFERMNRALQVRAEAAVSAPGSAIARPSAQILAPADDPPLPGEVAK